MYIALGQPLTESLLERVWQGASLRGDALLTSEGIRLRVVHPGRRAGGAGPDFHHAVIATAGERRCGDVELHVRSSAWRAHGHHHDPNYNGVILHVVFRDDARQPTLLENGTSVPVLPLEAYLTAATPTSALLHAAAEPCADAVTRLGATAVGEVLDRAGDARFRAKGRTFRSELAADDADQVLYHGLLRALGYSANTEPFGELARRVPMQTLERIAAATRSTERAAAFHRALSTEACRLRWRHCGCRPPNLPPQRIAAAARLLATHLEDGSLAQPLLGLVSRADVATGHRGLVNALRVAAGDHDGGIGRGRASEMVVNVLLPFCYAVGGARSRLHRRALALYRAFPHLDDNHVSREMAQQAGIGAALADSARRQQGLVHLYRRFCLERRCRRCPLR